MKRVIINADDFGYSDSVNHAIVQAHHEGILTSTSLMAAGDAFESAVTMAKQNPKLGVGLHVVTICGKSVLPFKEIPDIVNEDKNFSNSATLAGMQYYFEEKSRKQLEKEIRAQFQKFKETGLTCTHVDSHQHMHINPAIFDILLKVAREFEVTKIRIPDDDLDLTIKYDRKDYWRKLTHNFLFNRLVKNAKIKADQHRFKYPNKVYGLFQTGNMYAGYVKVLLESLREGDCEIYFHPDYESWYDLKGEKENKPNTELATLLDPQIKDLIQKHQIELINYKDIQ